MTEADWLVCTDSQKMLAFLQDKASDRKLRLFSCACYRHVFQMLPQEWSKELLERCETFADGVITYDELWKVACFVVADNRVAWGLREYDAWKGARKTAWESVALAVKKKER